VKAADEIIRFTRTFRAADEFHLHFINEGNFARAAGVRPGTLERTPILPHAGFRGAVIATADAAASRLPKRAADGIRVTLRD
jgi:hypothetical protein